MSRFNVLNNFLLLGLLIFTALTCNNNPVTPDDVKPGRRDYIWTVDSVDYDTLPGRIELYSIWGSSPDDVWGAGFTEDVRNCFWHYDGEKWSRAVWNTPITELGNGSKSVGGVWGTAQNDVWAFGVRLFSNPERVEPFIMHYDGNKWTEVIGDKNQMPIGFRDIYAISKDHFWISSSDYVSQYKNGVWKKYLIGENYIIQSIEGIGNSVYLTAYPIGIDSLFLMKLNGSEFRIIDKTNLISDGRFEHNALIFSNNKVYTFGNGVFSAQLNAEEIITSSWKNELKISIGEGFRNGYKIKLNSIWGLGFPNLLYHFNGENWQKIDIIHGVSESAYIGIWSNESEIFVGDVDNGKVYHGK